MIFIIVSDLGFHLEQGLYISRITPGSIVAKEGILTTGDRIVCVSHVIIISKMRLWPIIQILKQEQEKDL